jgi:hypothetical protein
MRSRCDLLSRSTAGLDDAGQPVETWTVAVASHPCRWERNEGTGSDNKYSYTIDGKIVTADYVFYMREPAGHVVNEEGYRIRFVERAGGKTLDVKLLRVMVRGDYGADHHLEIAAWIPSGRA